MHPIDQEIDRFQLSMMDLESMVDQNSYARLVDLFVQSLPLEQFGFTHTTHETTGRPPLPNESFRVVNIIKVMYVKLRNK
ncbi:MAG: Uncharacterised protein [Formosa sp. Hel1_33_131]|nr:MAG: Uncharacterised protein [Formosa sp. Hel1_33_131]|tara:strand:- start:4096 stop:4335 length:240 start_codon:yes stop_codon:yes gene_type:complete